MATRYASDIFQSIEESGFDPSEYGQAGIGLKDYGYLVGEGYSDEEIKKYAENDKSDDESMNKIAENIECKINMQEDIENSQKMKEHEENIESSDCSDNHSNDCIGNHGNCDKDNSEKIKEYQENIESSDCSGNCGKCAKALAASL